MLRHDGDRFVLVTPVEKVGIAVEDAPFVGVELAGDPKGGFRLPHQPRRVGGDSAKRIRCASSPAPRRRCEALRPRAGRPVGPGRALGLLRARGQGEVRDVDGTDVFGIASGPSFFPMMDAAALDEFGTDLALSGSALG